MTYAALKELKEKDRIESDENKFYSLTNKGEKELNSACNFFCKAFYDMKEMLNSCGR